MTRWHVHRSPGWVVVLRTAPLSKGSGGFGVLFMLGADSESPWRPWPVLWSERRPNGALLVALVWCGVGVGVQG